jgi:hypothetical protein
MATNLVSLVMDFLTPNMIGRISSALGLDRSAVQSAISGSIAAGWLQQRRRQAGWCAKAGRRRCASDRRSRRLFPHAWEGRPILAH